MMPVYQMKVLWWMVEVAVGFLYLSTVMAVNAKMLILGELSLPSNDEIEVRTIASRSKISLN